MVSDFAVIIAILVFVGVDELFLLETPKLIVPTVFKVQNSFLLSEAHPWNALVTHPTPQKTEFICNYFTLKMLLSLFLSLSKYCELRNMCAKC
jgi:hypothetical protein